MHISHIPKFNSLLDSNWTLLQSLPEEKYFLLDEGYAYHRQKQSTRGRCYVCLDYKKCTFGINDPNHFKCGAGRIRKIKPEKLYRHFSVQSSYDDEFRSSQSIAKGLHRRYQNVLDRGCSENLREFIKAGVTAYALGCTEEGLRKELLNISNTEVERSLSNNSNVHLRTKSTAEIEECILWLSIIFITILCTPQPTVVRWSETPPVSTETKLQWKGFCAVIANAYYTKGMAWLPVKMLQLEQMAVCGKAEEASVVAGRMRLVFATLEGKSVDNDFIELKDLQAKLTSIRTLTELRRNAEVQEHGQGMKISKDKKS